MESLPQIVSELVRAANEYDRLGDFEKRRLLDRAYRTVQEARGEIGVAPELADTDAAIDFLTISRAPDRFTDEDIREAILDAADMIKNLKIILDAKKEVEEE